jgi:hypothetical protein
VIMDKNVHIKQIKIVKISNVWTKTNGSLKQGGFG